MTFHGDISVADVGGISSSASEQNSTNKPPTSGRKYVPPALRNRQHNSQQDEQTPSSSDAGGSSSCRLDANGGAGGGSSSLSGGGGGGGRSYNSGPHDQSSFPSYPSSSSSMVNGCSDGGDGGSRYGNNGYRSSFNRNNDRNNSGRGQSDRWSSLKLSNCGNYGKNQMNGRVPTVNNANFPPLGGVAADNDGVNNKSSGGSYNQQLNHNHHQQYQKRHIPEGMTGWETRDGRRHNEEREAEVFGSVKSQSTGINFDSFDAIPVEMNGKGADKILPIESFQDSEGVHNLLNLNVKRVNYCKPTPIQKHAIPSILSGRDLMACAQTGSGKTAAFLFPIISKMLHTGPPPTLPPTRNDDGYHSYRRSAICPICLVLSPTRELAMQIFLEARKFQFGTGIRTVTVYGGCDVKAQLYELERGCDLCVATPGRLIDLVTRKKIRLNLISYLVLDEADRMLDMGFAPQIREIIDDHDMPDSCDGRQTVMFSATFPREIQDLAREFLQNYVYLAVGRVGSTNEFITQKLIYADEDQKPRYLVKLLRETDKGLTIIFVETKKKADLIEDFLLDNEFQAVSIHGDRTQQEREGALRYFKSGKRPILVATDVAARGLDISNVTHVINCDLPNNIDDYVHRIGRTGRAGNIGLASSFVCESNKPILRNLLALLEESRQSVPDWFRSLVMNSTSSGHRMGGSHQRHVGVGSDIRGGEGIMYTHLGRGAGSRRTQNEDGFFSKPNQQQNKQVASSATSQGFQDFW